jgi:hypothetical protein
VDSAAGRGNKRRTLADAEGKAVDCSELGALGFKALRTKKFLVHEQSIKENVCASQRHALLLLLPSLGLSKARDMSHVVAKAS